MTVRGKRAKVKVAEEPKPQIEWQKKDRVVFPLDEAGEDLVEGKIVKILEDGLFRVRLPNGDKYNVHQEYLRPPIDGHRGETRGPDDDEYADKKGRGFTQYSINWDNELVNFASRVKGVMFTGWWRKRGFESYAIDIYAKQDGKEISVEPLSYHGDDPRDDVDSLNGDICAAINKWFHLNFHPEEEPVSTIDSLRSRAERPTIKIRRVATLDRLILNLKEYRDTSLRCGGNRFVKVEGDEKGSPLVTIDIHLTSAAMVLDGKKPPNLYSGAILDAAVMGRGKGDRGEVFEKKGNDQNVKDLKAQLKAARGRGDKTEARKIRSVLRKLGHRGGARHKDAE